VDTEDLADSKKGAIIDEADFVKCATRYFTEYHQALIPCINVLWKVIPRYILKEGGGRMKIKDCMTG
jgi:hypothetical protein